MIKIGRWESLRGRYWVELYQDSTGYSVRGDNFGGYLGNIPESLALVKIASEIECWPVKSIKKIFGPNFVF